ncbi:MAG: hypothetical protein AABY18_04175 [Candidatus Thermoplasmatota archaeon]
MSRPVWSDKGNDAQAVADHLEALANTATALRFAPATLPPGTDLAVLHQAAMLRVRKQLSQSHAEADRILSQEVRAIDDLVRTANLLVERLREWYALHAPEATRMVTDAETLAKLVAEKGERGAVMEALDQAKAAASSLGSDLDPADMAVLRGFAAALAAVHDSWHALENRVSEAMTTVAPNVASVVGPVIGARLIALSGGLNRLATWPAGTVQLLGAETALFRHIKEGTKPPKHGILFQHPSVHQAPMWQRGAIARCLALATAKAAKADAFTKNDLRPLLAEEVKVTMARIQRERAKPPVRKSWGPPRSFGGQRRGPPARGGAPHRAPAPRFGEGARPSGGGGGGGGWQRRDDRGPPRSSGPNYDRAPQREGFGGGAPAPARRFDDRAPPAAPREGGFPRRDDGGSGGFPPRSDGPRPDGGGFAPRQGFGGGAPRDGPRDAARGGFSGPRDAPRGGFDSRGPRDGPRDGPRGGGWSGGGGGGGFGGKPKRKPQGAFRGDGGPAAPPGKARKKEDDE